jgi:hypothetical protein
MQSNYSKYKLIIYYLNFRFEVRLEYLHLYISLWLYSPFVGPWPFYQFLNCIHSRYDSLDGGSAHLKAAAYTQNNTNTEYTYTDIHALSGIRIHDPSVRASEDSSCLRLCNHSDRQNIFIVEENIYHKCLSSISSLNLLLSSQFLLILAIHRLL